MTLDRFGACGRLGTCFNNAMGSTTPMDFEFDGVSASDLWGGRCYGVVIGYAQGDLIEAGMAGDDVARRGTAERRSASRSFLSLAFSWK